MDNYTYEYFAEQVLEFRNLLTNKEYFYNKPEIIVNAFKALTYVYFNTVEDSRILPLYKACKTELDFRAKYSPNLLTELLS